MKVAVSSSGQTIDDPMDTRFGRAAFFLMVATGTLEFMILDHAAQAASGGAGIAAAQSVIDQQVDAVITGQRGKR